MAEVEKIADEVVAVVEVETPAVAVEVAAPAAEIVKPVTVHKADFEKEVVYLYQFTRTPALPSLSPYCLKVETWLRLANIKYEVFSMKIHLKNIFLKKFFGKFSRMWTTRSNCGRPKVNCRSSSSTAPKSVTLRTSSSNLASITVAIWMPA